MPSGRISVSVNNWELSTRLPGFQITFGDPSGQRGEVQATIESGATIPIVYGIAGVRGIAVYRETLPNTRITAGVTQNTARNRRRFGDWFAGTQNREARQLLMQQYVLGVGEFLEVLTLFVNNESINYDGYLAPDNRPAGNIYSNSAHHWGSGAVDLAAAFSSNRQPSDAFTGLTAVTGLYKGQSNFGGLPQIFAFVYGVNPVYFETNGTISRSTSAPTPYAVGALADWLMSGDYGLSIPSDEFALPLWSRASAFGGEDLGALMLRIRQASYDADTSDPKDPDLSLDVPPDYRYAASGVLASGLAPAGYLAKFTEVMPSMLLWERFDGKLGVDLWDADSPRLAMTVREADLLEHPRIIEQHQQGVDQVSVLFNGYEGDFAEDTITSGFTFGQRTYTTPGTYVFHVPIGVDEITAQIRGASGGSGGLGDNLPTSNPTYHQAARWRSLAGLDGGDGGEGHTDGADGAQGAMGMLTLPETGQQQFWRPGGGQGGQGGSSAVVHEGSAQEAAGGAGGAGGFGASARFLVSQQRLLAFTERGLGIPGVEGETFVRTIPVTPGGTVEITVGAGGGIGEHVTPALVDSGHQAVGEPGYVNLYWSKGELAENRVTRRIDLCFNQAQAERLSKEHAEASKLVRYELAMTRRGIALEPGDTILLDYRGLFDDIGMRVIDMDFDQHLQPTLLCEGRGFFKLAAAPMIAIDAVADIDETETAALRATLSGGAYDEIELQWSAQPGGAIADDTTLAGTFTPDSVDADTEITATLTVTVRGTGMNASRNTSASASASVRFTVRNV